jgi:hypothetical protein
LLPKTLTKISPKKKKAAFSDLAAFVIIIPIQRDISARNLQYLNIWRTCPKGSASSGTSKTKGSLILLP